MSELHAPRRRGFRRRYLFLARLLCIPPLGTIISGRAGGQDALPKQEQPAIAPAVGSPPQDDAAALPKITISRETTYLTEPLDADGYVDYLAALNALGSEGVTPDNNAVVELVRVMGIPGLDPAVRAGFFAKLGIAELSAHGDYLRLPEEIWGEHELTEFTHRPWGAAELPALAEWLKDHDQELDRLSRASQRSKFYAPYVVHDRPAVIGCISARLAMDLVRDQLLMAYCSRAMLNLNQGRTEEAVQDLLTVYRWTNLLGDMPEAVMYQALVPLGMTRFAQGSWEALLSSPDLTSNQAKRIFQELKQARQLVHPREAMSIGERFSMLDAICNLERESHTSTERNFQWLVLQLIDWDRVLRDFNHVFDLAESGFAEDGTINVDNLNAYDDALDARADQAHLLSDHPELATLAAIVDPRAATTQSLTVTLAATMLPGGSIFACSISQAEASRRVLQVAAAVVAYRQADGNYPDSLDALVPDYFSELPGDPFHSQGLRYVVTQTGFKVYSVGNNWQDDGGVIGDYPLPLDIVFEVGAH